MDFEPPDDDDPDIEYVEVDPTGRYGRYKEELGRGAYKIVYKAFDKVKGIEVAWYKARFQKEVYHKEEHYREVELLKSLKHSNIIKYYNSWVDVGPSYVDLNIITEIFSSGTLKEYRKKHKKTNTKAVKSWARQILCGLVHLHSHSPPIVHRDLKCDNIFVHGNTGEVKIGDLGLAVMQRASRGCSARGTLEFMAPEMFEGNYNESVDIYAFGMCLVELETLEYPYSECKHMGEIYRNISKGRKPASLDKVKDPELRYLIELCIGDAFHRPSAQELLNHPWLQPLEVISDSEAEHEHEDMYTKRENLYTSTESPQLKVQKDFKLKGNYSTEGYLSLSLQIITSGKMRDVQFSFDTAVDTARGVASEMSEALGLLDEDVTTIADLIQGEIMLLVPNAVAVMTVSEEKSESISAENTAASVDPEFKIIHMDLDIEEKHEESLLDEAREKDEMPAVPESLVTDNDTMSATEQESGGTCDSMITDTTEPFINLDNGMLVLYPISYAQPADYELYGGCCGYNQSIETATEYLKVVKNGLYVTAGGNNLGGNIV